MRKLTIIALVLVLVLGTFSSVALARDIERIDGAVYTNQWTTSYYMYKYRAHSDPAVVFIESTTGQVVSSLFNTASENCLGDQLFSGRERRLCAWQGTHGQPGYRYFAGVYATAYRSVTSSFSPDTY